PAAAVARGGPVGVGAAGLPAAFAGAGAVGGAVTAAARALAGEPGPDWAGIT
ncbi:MAG: hypothetical protein IRY85_17610, partial [Micromonosporaceae bacterium]|nr:hypothetical protein [Micromonosporaceae bacterium]